MGWLRSRKQDVEEGGSLVVPVWVCLATHHLQIQHLLGLFWRSPPLGSPRYGGVRLGGESHNGIRGAEPVLLAMDMLE